MSEQAKVVFLLRMLLSGAIILVAILVLTVQAQGGTTTVTLTDDLYIDDASSLHGAETVLKVSWDYRTFLRFDISSIPEGAEDITAVLELHTAEVPFGWWGWQRRYDVVACPIWNNTGDENTNPPRYEDTGELDRVRIISERTWYRWTVTDAVVGAIANNSNAVSIVLRYPVEDEAREISFVSKESPLARAPKLTITWASVTPVDVTPPTTTDDYDSSWHVSNFMINLSATDSDSGVAATYYRINSGSTQTVSLAGQPYITTEGAANTLEYWSVDFAGNEETPHKLLTNIKLDRTAPSGSIQINNDQTYTTIREVTLALSFTDDTSGVYQVRFSNDDAWDTESWEAPIASKSWVLSSGDGTKTVYYQVRDNAGLTSATYSDNIVLDTAAPTGSIVINGGDASVSSTAVTLSLTYADSTSGVYLVRYSNDGIWDTEEWESPATTKSWTLTSGDGTKTVHYQIKDNTKRVSSTYSDTIILSTSTLPSKVATPTFSPSGGIYTSPQSIALSCSTDGATIRYTLDGSEPNSLSTLYSNPILINSTTTIKAKAFKSEMTDSDTAQAAYTITVEPQEPHPDKVSTPTFSPVGSTYSSPQNVTIECATSGATIRYTVDGSEPTADSMVYSDPIAVTSTTTIKAKAFMTGMTDSDTASATYTIGTIDINGKVATPTFSPSGGTYASPQYVVIFCDTPGAVVYYTTSGDEPSPSSLRYYGPIPVSATTTLKAKAFVEGMTESDTATATYTITRDVTSEEEPSFDNTIIYAAIGTVAIVAVAVGILFYLRKREKQETTVPSSFWE